MESFLSKGAKILVTGATGFIGATLVRQLSSSGYQVIGIGRTPPNEEFKPCFETFHVFDLNQTPFNTKLLKDVYAIINLAGLAHNASTGDESLESAYMKLNAEFPKMLAIAAREMGVQKFIHLSSVKAVSETSPRSQPLTEEAENIGEPASLYGRSKRAAEKFIGEALKNSSTQFIILRPPLVYGPNAKGTLLQLIRLVNLKVPLPLKSSKARRSFISIHNLCSAIEACLDEKNTSSGVFFVSDGESVGVVELVEMIGMGMNVKVWLFRCPEFILKFIIRTLGKVEIFEKLFLDLVIQSERFQRTFSWNPQNKFQQDIQLMADSYLREKNKKPNL